MFDGAGGSFTFEVRITPLELGQPETLGRYRIVDGLLSAKADPFLSNERELPLSAELFADDALIFKSIDSSKVAVRCRKHGRVVVVDTGGAPHLGLWAKPGADYVSIEPWWGHDDPADADGELARKPSILDPTPRRDVPHAPLPAPPLRRIDL